MAEAQAAQQTEQPAEKIKILDHNGRPIQRNTFYASDSLCYLQASNREERLIADARTSEDTLYRVIYADESQMDLVYFGRFGETFGIERKLFCGDKKSREISVKGKEAAELASRLRPLSILVIKKIADEYKEKAKTLDDALFDTLERANSFGQKTQ